MTEDDKKPDDKGKPDPKPDEDPKPSPQTGTPGGGEGPPKDND